MEQITSHIVERFVVLQNMVWDYSNTSELFWFVEEQVFRKATHTNKYLAYKSHHPAQHKRSVINTLLHRANTIPSNHTLKMDEMKCFQESLQINGYPAKFMERAAAPRSNPRSGEPEHTGLAVAPYVKGVSDQVKRALQQSGVKTVFKPMRTLASIFKKPKDRPSEDRITGIRNPCLVFCRVASTMKII